MKINWQPVKHPPIPSIAWTKILDDSRGTRKGMIIHNESSSADVRIAMSWVEPTVANEGLMLYSGGDGSLTQDYDSSYSGPVWAYQTSGSAITSLAVQEGF